MGRLYEPTVGGMEELKSATKILMASRRLLCTNQVLRSCPTFRAFSCLSFRLAVDTELNNDIFLYHLVVYIVHQWEPIA